MGFFDDAHAASGEGAPVTKGAVSTVTGEQLAFVREFCRMCEDGWRFGYHERNGGNASYRLAREDVKAMRPFFRERPGSWEPCGVPVSAMAGEHLLLTGSSKHMRNVAHDPAANVGVVELSADGDAWRVVWGLKGGGRPTSEIAAHVAAHGVCKRVTDGAARVLYHAHPGALVALTALIEPDARTLTRILWGAHTEAIIAIPRGIGALGVMTPGSSELARATAAALETYDACAWRFHGVLASGVDFDEALGLVCAIDKAADVYLRTRAVQGGGRDTSARIEDGDLRATAAAYGLPVNEDFLA